MDYGGARECRSQLDWTNERRRGLAREENSDASSFFLPSPLLQTVELEEKTHVSRPSPSSLQHQQPNPNQGQITFSLVSSHARSDRGRWTVEGKRLTKFSPKEPTAPPLSHPANPNQQTRQLSIPNTPLPTQNDPPSYSRMLKNTSPSPAPRRTRCVFTPGKSTGSVLSSEGVVRGEVPVLLVGGGGGRGGGVDGGSDDGFGGEGGFGDEGSGWIG